MELLLKRIAKKRGYTIGRLYLVTYTKPLSNPYERHDEEGVKTYLCDTLEPTALELKTTLDKAAVLRSPAKTTSLKPFAIPEGQYPVAVTWSPRFGQWLPLLLHVRGFDGIRIHAGNTAQDTRGCILVGQNLKPGQVLNSRIQLKHLISCLNQRPEGEPVWITVE